MQFSYKQHIIVLPIHVHVCYAHVSFNLCLLMITLCSVYHVVFVFELVCLFCFKITFLLCVVLRTRELRSVWETYFKPCWKGKGLLAR